MYENAAFWATVAEMKRAESLNRFLDDGGGLGVVATAGQRYHAFGIGYFRTTPDEALLIEVKPPRPKYWGIHLGNYWMESPDFANHHSSINGFQAQLDRDGVFRAVLSLSDPGVPNWLAPAGHAEGTMIYRWNQAQEAPVPTTRLVSLSELRNFLPPDTPVVTADERADIIERRRQHVRRRYGRLGPRSGGSMAAAGKYGLRKPCLRRGCESTPNTKTRCYRHEHRPSHGGARKQRRALQQLRYCQHGVRSWAAQAPPTRQHGCRSPKLAGAIYAVAWLPQSKNFITAAVPTARVPQGGGRRSIPAPSRACFWWPRDRDGLHAARLCRLVGSQYNSRLFCTTSGMRVRTR